MVAIFSCFANAPIINFNPIKVNSISSNLTHLNDFLCELHSPNARANCSAPANTNVHSVNSILLNLPLNRCELLHATQESTGCIVGLGVKYLVGLDTSTLVAVDNEANTVLHYACRGAKNDTIALLLEKTDAASVSRQNAQGKLPIDLLWESNAVEDRESIEYTESVYSLLKAYPEMIRR